MMIISQLSCPVFFRRFLGIFYIYLNFYTELNKIILLKYFIYFHLGTEF